MPPPFKPPMPPPVSDDLIKQRQAFMQSRRDNINQQRTAGNQEAGEAIQRRFTALGQGGSGAAIAAGIKARESVDQTANQAMNDLAGQDLQAQFQEAQLKDSEAGRLFGANEAQLGRDFASGQAAQDMALKRDFFGTEQGNKLKELDLAERHYLLEKDAQEFNKQMAGVAQPEDGGLFGGGGFLGTGIKVDDIKNYGKKSFVNPVIAQADVIKRAIPKKWKL